MCVRVTHLVMLAAAFSTLAEAAEASCNLATLKGSYSFVASGQIINEPAVPVPPGPVSSVGRAVSDGNGNVTFEQLGSYSGVPSAENGTGTYAVTSGCVITLIINAPPPVSFPVTYQGTISPTGDTLAVMQTDPVGTMIKVNWKRVPNNCTFKDLLSPA